MNPNGRDPWLEVGAMCASRTGPRHLIESSTQVYKWTNAEGRVIRNCLECRRRAARIHMADLKAARKAGYASTADYRRVRAEAARKEALLAEAMAAWETRIRRAQGL